jgi:hypothetical protein
VGSPSSHPVVLAAFGAKYTSLLLAIALAALSTRIHQQVALPVDARFHSGGAANSRVFSAACRLRRSSIANVITGTANIAMKIATIARIPSHSALFT